MSTVPKNVEKSIPKTVKTIGEWIEESWHIEPDTQGKIFLSILTFLVLWTLQKFILKIIYRRITDPKQRYGWRNGVRNVYYSLIFLIITAIWVESVNSLATFLGIVTAGLAIALQDIVAGFVGWLFIISRKPFEVGDRIQIGENVAGDVIDIRFFQFTINEIGNWVDAEQSTGRIIHVPNGKVFKENIANYNQGFTHIWNEIGILITFESNWEKARKILLEILEKETVHLSESAEKRLRRASEKFMIFYQHLTPTIYLTVKDSGVMLTMRYICPPRSRRNTEEKLWEAILKTFSQHEDIDLAYPTQRIFYNPMEGKKGTPPLAR
ncbi:mechanosensitive ion channel family protein [Algivirga pacifica]|uniref:Mechanosensitive ion channel n=1 Tax=Algivirga pacifica TaxID=1162670 RepID=A0ABP9D6J8_9BACT